MIRDGGKGEFEEKNENCERKATNIEERRDAMNKTHIREKERSSRGEEARKPLGMG